MGRDRLLPARIFAYVHAKYSTPATGSKRLTWGFTGLFDPETGCVM